MSLNINSEVFITCALTGSGSTQEKSKFVPRSPKEIADDAILAAKSGASIVHCHVRYPNTGVPSRKLEYYKEVTDRIRNSNTFEKIIFFDCSLFFFPNVIALSIFGFSSFALGKVVVICSYLISELSIFLNNAFLCSEVLLSFL